MTDHPVPDEALDADIAVVGKKGRGKTYVAKGLVERLLDMQRRVIVLDPLGHWWGLKASADGKAAGYPVAVFGGDHADVPIAEASAKPLATALAGTNLPAVVDLGQLHKSAQSRFVADFLEELFRANRDPLWLVLEEADVFAPQNPYGDHAQRVLSEVDRIARRGRAYGFRLITMTQRPARLHKDVLTQLSVLIAMGLSSPQDRDAIKAWVEGNADRDVAKDVYATLASLPVGEGWLWAPDFSRLERVKFPPIRTLDTSRTPKHGEKRIQPKTLAQVDLAEVRKALQTPAPAPSADKAASADPALAARIRQLETELGARPTAADLLATRQEGAGAAIDHALKCLETFTGALHDFRLAHAGRPKAPDPAPTAGTEQPKAEPGTGSIDDAQLGTGKRKILTALAQHGPCAKGKLAILTGYTAGGSSLRNYLSELRVAGLVEGTGKSPVHITPLGRQVLGPYDPLPTGAALVDVWLGQLAKAEREIVKVLVAHQGRPLARSTVAATTGYEPDGSTMRNALSRLRVLGLVEGSRELRINPELVA